MKPGRSLISFGVLGLAGLLLLCALLVGLVLFGFSTNERDNGLPWMRGEMVRCTRLWGRLAPFPSTAQGFTIRTEGNPFTRTFRGSFSDTPEHIQDWLKSSPGAAEGRRNENRIELKTGEGAAYGEIILSPDGTHVDFRSSWS